MSEQREAPTDINSNEFVDECDSELPLVELKAVLLDLSGFIRGENDVHDRPIPNQPEAEQQAGLSGSRAARSPTRGTDLSDRQTGPLRREIDMQLPARIRLCHLLGVSTCQAQ